MIEIMDNIVAYLNSKLPSIVESDIAEDFFIGDSDEELMCRHDVSPLIYKAFMDGSYRATFAFSFYCRSGDVITARQKLEAIMECLNEIRVFQHLFGVAEGTLEVTARPTPISEEEGGTKIYTCAFKLDYLAGD